MSWLVKDFEGSQELITILTSHWDMQTALRHFLKEDNAILTPLLWVCMARFW